MACLITLWIVSCEAQNILIFMKSRFFFSFITYAFGVRSKKSSPASLSKAQLAGLAAGLGWGGVGETERSRRFRLPPRLLARAS